MRFDKMQGDSGPYVEVMRSKAIAAFDVLHEGVQRLVFCDFPDYPNVGDSAIALGQFEYWDTRGICVEKALPIQLLTGSVLASPVTVALNGGGNLGGLYPALSEHRYRLAEGLEANTLLIQLPQSVYFINTKSQDEFRRRMAVRHNLRIAVRDHTSFNLLKDDVDVLLSPDAVHLLGRIETPPPIRPYVVLARTDQEASLRDKGIDDRSIDWLDDPLSFRLFTKLLWRTKQVPFLVPGLRRPVDFWRKRAGTRFVRGVRALSSGEIIVTNRLHAMLIGLQMGKRVIAVDNNNAKLSSYAETWLTGFDLDLQFAPDLVSAITLAEQMR